MKEIILLTDFIYNNCTGECIPKYTKVTLVSIHGGITTIRHNGYTYVTDKTIIFTDKEPRR
jgi:hypothetical protein